MHVSRPCRVGMLALLTACGSASPIGFTAPPGWTATLKILGTQKFTNPRNGAEFVMIAIPRAGTKPRGTAIRICGDHPAVLEHGRATLGTVDSQMDQVSVAWGDAREAAMYARPYGSPADPAAERAIRSLCVPAP